MAKRSVNVLIKARDEASHKFLRIGGAAKIMGKMLKGVGSTIKTAFVTALKAANYAAVGLGVAMVGATYKAIKQQAAELELASALKVTNQYSEAAMQRLKEQAAAIQDVTTYGDEYIMTLQRMAVTLGVTEEKATDAAKAARYSVPSQDVLPAGDGASRKSFYVITLIRCAGPGHLWRVMSASCGRQRPKKKRCLSFKRQWQRAGTWPNPRPNTPPALFRR